MKRLLHLVEERGAWPFITWQVFRAVDGRKHVWSSRQHRKGLLIHAATEAEGRATQFSRCLWSPGQLNWWIGTVFALGSLLFAVASVLSLAPALARAWSLDTTAVNAVFFAGSIPFTTAAYLQLFQAANATPFQESDSQPTQLRKLFGWQPGDAGWLSSAMQFVGTILFNFNTFDAMIPELTWFEQDLVVWVPDFIGSILFLLSGYLAFVETCHTHWAWLPRSISWWVVFINLLGCAGFMASAGFSIYYPGSPSVDVAKLASSFTLQGAVCFLIGSLLMLPEMAIQSIPRNSSSSSRRGNR